MEVNRPKVNISVALSISEAFDNSEDWFTNLKKRLVFLKFFYYVCHNDVPKTFTELIAICSVLKNSERF